MSDENLITLTVEERLNNAQAEIVKYQRMMQDEARDASIMLAMLHHFVTRCVERGETNSIKYALEFAHDDTGICWDSIAEAVERMGICDPTLCKQDFNVHITIPVTVSISVQAFDEADAEEQALSELECNGLDNYYMDYNSYDASYEVEEG